MLHAQKIIVIADDLSGAAELTGIAFSHGLSAEVQRQFDPSTEAELIALDTDSRHRTPAAAADCVRLVAEQVIASNPAWLFKKVDSILRGNVRAEIEAILGAARLERAVLVPANPSRGRTIVQRQYLIDGLPLHQTNFARDPEHPRRSSDVGSLLGSAGSGAIFVPDVATQPQIQKLAEQCGAGTLASGAADFFAALLHERCGPRRSPTGSPALAIVPPAILVCGSQAAWPSRRQQCDMAGVPIMEIASGFRTGVFQNLLIGIGESESASNDLVLPALAKLAQSLIQMSAARALLAEGGATAAAIAQQMNWTRFNTVATAPAGVGVLRPIDNQPSPLVLIKPGSYPWPAEIWDAFVHLNRA